MKYSQLQVRNIGIVSLTTSLLIATQVASAQSTTAIAIEGLNNDNTPMYATSEVWTDGSTATASMNQSFTGQDGAGQTQTMNFTGQTVASATYGSLHCYTTGTLTNSYYNPNNSAYIDQSGNIGDPNGTPDSLASLGFAIFTDTFQFGGNLQSGYQAKYIFHVDGTNSGVGGSADLAVNVAGAATSSFFDFNNGYYSADWVTSDYAVNGNTPQQIEVQFSDQAVFNTFQLADGFNYTGTSDFGATCTLAGVELVDQNGNLVSGWNLTSGSGTSYHTIESVPELGTLPVFLALLAPTGILGLRRRSAKLGR